MAGSISTGYNVEIGYYDQENQNLTPENTVLDELWNAYPTRTETEIRGVLAMFRFVGESVFKTVSVLSGGERARLTFAKLMLSRMNLLVLDEPTNHMDMDSREALEEAIGQFDGTVVMVSHDRYLIDKLATRILEIKPHAAFGTDLLDYQVTKVGGGYTEFSEYKAARIAEREGANVEIVQLAALLHDVDDRKLSPDTYEGQIKTRRFLAEHGLENDAIEQICRIIREVSFGANTEAPTTLEGNCVQDADRLDAIGALGIARAFAYGGHHNRLMHRHDVAHKLNMTR